MLVESSEGRRADIGCLAACMALACLWSMRSPRSCTFLSGELIFVLLRFPSSCLYSCAHMKMAVSFNQGVWSLFVPCCGAALIPAHMQAVPPSTPLRVCADVFG